MKLYEVETVETVVASYWIMADSPDEAIEKCKDGVYIECKLKENLGSEEDAVYTVVDEKPIEE